MGGGRRYAFAANYCGFSTFTYQNRKVQLMRNDFTSTRRQFIKIGSAAIASIPLLAVVDKAYAATNAALRTAMKYQDKPGPDNKACATCVQFVPGKAPADLGGCKLFAGDTEVSPKGYCVAWAAKPK
jgi:hypothetical protein